MFTAMRNHSRRVSFSVDLNLVRCGRINIVLMVKSAQKSS